MSGAVHLLAAKALHEYAERHRDDPIEGASHVATLRITAQHGSARCSAVLHALRCSAVRHIAAQRSNMCNMHIARYSGISHAATEHDVMQYNHSTVQHVALRCSGSRHVASPAAVCSTAQPVAARHERASPQL